MDSDLFICQRWYNSIQVGVSEENYSTKEIFAQSAFSQRVMQYCAKLYKGAGLFTKSEARFNKARHFLTHSSLLNIRKYFPQ